MNAYVVWWCVHCARNARLHWKSRIGVEPGHHRSLKPRRICKRDRFFVIYDFFPPHDSNDSEFSSRRIECFISFNWFEKLLKVSCPTIDKTRSGETGERWMICKGNEDGNNGGGSRYRFALAVALTLRGAWFIELNRVRVSLIRRVVYLSDKSTSSPPFFFLLFLFLFLCFRFPILKKPIELTCQCLVFAFQYKPPGWPCLYFFPSR